MTSSNIKNVMHKHNGTNQKSTEVVKRASNCAKKRTHHLIVDVVTNGKEKSIRTSSTQCTLSEFRVCVDDVETRGCIACKLHRQRDAFSQDEWEHAQRTNEQGKCKDCRDRAEQHMWQCNRCGQTLHTSFYSKWFEKHTTNNTKVVRCDRCIAVEEQ